MPFVDTLQARDAILGKFNDAWSTITPTPPRVFYPATDNDSPEGDEPYVSVRLQHEDGFQPGIGARDGVSRRYRAVGVLVAYIYVPLSLDDGGRSAYQYGKVLQDAFEGSSTGADEVEFRRVRLIEVPKAGAFFRLNFMADFDYDRVK